MGTNQTAAIRSALLELAQAAENGEPGELCATFTVSDRSDVWVQVMSGTVNASYPREDEPLAFLQSAGIPPLAGLAVESWVEGTFATFTHEPESPQSIALFVDRLLIALHALHPEDYPMDVEWERL